MIEPKLVEISKQNPSVHFLDHGPVAQHSENYTNQYLCFNQWTPGLIVSPSGLICQIGEATKEPFYAVLNTKISTECFKWEMICPISCQGIQFGIVREGFDLTKLEKVKDKHSISLVTSTPRNIMLELDMRVRTLKVWLNGYPKEKKFILNIEDGPWHPYVEIRGQGNIVILNPSLSCRQDRIPQLTLPSQIANQYDSELMKQQIENTFRNEAKQNHLINLSNLQFKTVNNNMIVINENLIKLIAPNLNKQIDEYVYYNAFQTTPGTENDLVLVSIETKAFDGIFKNLDLDQILGKSDNMITVDNWTTFVAHLSERVNFQERTFIKAPYIAIQQAVVALVSYYESYLNYLVPIVEKDQDQTEAQFALRALQQKGFDYKILTCEELLYFIMELLAMDEQLNALFFDNGSKKINSRIFSAYGRMSYFIDQVIPVDAIRLAQSGMIMEPGRQFNLMHYLEPNRKLINLSRSQNTDESISKLLPDTNLCQTARFFNIPLNFTVNARCPRILPLGKYQFADLSNTNSSFLTVYGQDGRATIMNCEIALFEVGEIDLRALLDDKQLQNKQHYQKTGKQRMNYNVGDDEQLSHIFSIFQEQEANTPEDDPGHSSEIYKPINSQEDLVPKDEPIVPNQSLLDQLYSMGFTLEMAKEVLILTKNAGLDQALEAILELQVNKPVVNVEELKKELKMQWCCSFCTFLNSDANESCVMCASAPPPEAYIVEVEEVEIIKDQTPELPVEQDQQSIQKSEESNLKDRAEDEKAVKNQEFKLKQEYLSDVGQSRIDQVLQINIGDITPVSPILLAIVFNNLQKSQNPLLQNTILFKRLMLPYSIFTPFHQHKLVNLLRNTDIDLHLTLKILESQFLVDEDCRKIVQTWAPLFSNNSQKFAYKFDEVEQFVITLDHQIQRVIDFTQNTQRYLAVFTSEALRIYSIGLANQELIVLNVALVCDFALKIEGIQNLIEVDGVLYLSTVEQLIRVEIAVESNKHTLTYLTHLLENKSQIKSLEYKNKLLFVECVNSTVMSFSIAYDTLKVEETIIQTEQPLEIHSLSASEIKSLASLTSQEPVYLKSNSFKQAIQLNDQPYYQRHLYTEQEATLTLQEAGQIASLNIELTLKELFEPQNQIITSTSGQSKQGDQIHLPLQVFSFSGAQFNNTTFLTKVLYPQEENFTSNYPYPTYVFSHLHSQSMLIESIIVTSNIRASQKGYPLGAGLIFVSENPANLTMKKWDQWTKEHYLQFRNNKLKRNSPFLESDPVGYFELAETQESGMFYLDIKRPCKYVMMIPTRFRAEIMQKHFSSSSVEFKFFGVQGQVIDQADTPPILQQSIQLPDKVKITVECNGQELPNLMESVQFSIQSSSYEDIKPTTRLCICVQHKQLQTLAVHTIKIKIQPIDSLVWWSVNAAQPTKVQKSIMEKLPQASQLRVMMTNVDLYEKLNQKLVLLSQDENATFAQRISCIDLLGSIMNSNKLVVKRVIQDLNLKQFLILNLQMSNQEPIVQRFLQNFYQIPDFIKEVQVAVLDILQNLYQINHSVTPQGLQFLMSLVFWLARMNTNEVLPILFEHLKQAAKLVSQIKSTQPIYDQMGDRYTHAEFDSQFFSEFYSNLCKPLVSGDVDANTPLFKEIESFQSSAKSQESPNETISQDQKLQVIKLKTGQNAPSRIAFRITSKSTHSYLVDLYAVYQIQWFSIFMVNQQKQAKMRIQVYQEDNLLLFDQLYGDWVMYQLTQAVGDHRFAHANLNELRVPLNIKCRYLTIQVTFSHTVLCPTMLEATQIPATMALIPEFQGQLVGEDGFQAQFNDTFEKFDDNLSMKHLSMRFGNSQIYKHFQKSETFQILDSAGLYGESSPLAYEVQVEEDVKASDIQRSDNDNKIYKSYIESLQGKLRDKVLVNQGTVDAVTIRASLRKLHLQLLKSQPMSPQQFNQSIDFLFTLSYQLMEIVLNVDELHQTWRGQAPLNALHGLKLSEHLFHTFVIEESGPIRDISLKLLQNVLLDNLQEKHWVNFIFGLYDKMGGDQNKDRLITENLSKLSIPLPETLLYVAAQLKIIPGVLQNMKLSKASIKALIELLIKAYQVSPQVGLIPSAQATVGLSRGNKRELLDLYHQKLQPPGNKRSTSSNDTPSILNEPIDQLSILKLSFQVALLMSTETPELATRQFLSILARTNPENIKEFLYQTCIEPKELNMMYLVTNLLKQHGRSNQNNLKSLLQDLFQPRLLPLNIDELALEMSPEDQIILLSQKEALNQCQKISTYLLSQLIEEMVVAQQQPTTYYHQVGDDQSWLDQLTFIIEIYSNWVDCINKELKEQKGTPMRKLSQQKSLQPTMDIIENYKHFTDQLQVEKQCQFCSSQTINLLISLLKRETQIKERANTFYRSTQYWVLIIRVVQRLRTNQLVEQRIIDQIVTIYLTELEEDIQQILFIDILNLTKTLTQQSTKNIAEINSFLLTLFLRSQKSPLVRQLMTALLPSSTKVCRLNMPVTEYLLEQTGLYLLEHCNLLGRDGTVGCPDSLQVQLQQASYMTRILAQAEYQPGTLAIVQCYRESKNLDQSIHNLLKWALYNSQPQQVGVHSPALDLMRCIYADVTAILLLTKESATTTRISLQQLLVVFGELESNILPNQSYSVYQRYQLGVSALHYMEQCLSQWLSSTSLIREFCLNLDGFACLLKWVGARPTEDPLKSLQEKEAAQKVTLINLLPGQNFSNAGQDWSVNKKGVKARLLNFAMTDQFEEEYPLLIKLEPFEELKTIRLGFVTYTADFVDKVFGVPSAVLVEGGMDENNLQALGRLDLINDEAYTAYTVKVFQLNLLRGLRRSPGQVTYLKFRIRRPIVTFLEGQSQLVGRQYQNVHIALSFLSIGGLSYDLKEVTLKDILEVRKEETAFSILEKLCAPKFNVISEFANSPTFIAQLTQEFEKLSTALSSNGACLGPLLVGLSRHNQTFGDWVLHNFTCLRRGGGVHAKLVAQIIMQDEEMIVPRLLKLLAYVLANLREEDVKAIVQLTLLMDAFTICLIQSARNLRNQLVQEIALDVTAQDLLQLLHIIRGNHQLAQSKIFIKLLVNLIYLPFPYTYATELDSLSIVLRECEPLKEPFLFQLISPLLLGSQVAVEWAQSHLSEWMESLLLKLQDVIQTDSSIFHYFTCFDTIVKIPSLKDAIIAANYHTTIYDMLKLDNKSQGLLKPFDPLAIPLIVSFLGQCALSSSTQINLLTQALIHDLQVLATTVDMTFVESVLMPLLNFEERADICIDIWDSDQHQYVSDLKFLLDKVKPNFQADEKIVTLKSTQQTDFLQQFNSEILGEHKQKLNEAIHRHVNPQRHKPNSHWKLVHAWSVDGESTKMTEILAAMKQEPFLIIIDGQNNYTDKPSIIGVYCTSTLSECKVTPTVEYDQQTLAESKDSFFFAYEDPNYFHYQAADAEQPGDFGIVYSNKTGGQIVFQRKGAEIINLSFKEDSNSYIEFNNYDHKPYEQAIEDFYISDFQFSRAEFWVLQPTEVQKSTVGAQMLFQQVQGSMSVSNFGYGQLSTQILPNEFLNMNSILSYFSATPIYSVPQAASTEDIVDVIQISNVLALQANTTLKLSPNEQISALYLKSISQMQKTQSLVSLEVDGLLLLQELATTNEIRQLKYSSNLQVFDVFQKLDGIKQIIETARGSVSRWTNLERAKVWGQYIEELHAFSAVPAFFSFFLKNKQSMQLLFELLAGLPDKSTDKKYEDLEQSAVKFIYQTLSEVFQSSNNEQIRVVAIEKELIGKILDRIGLVSKEVKRKRLDYLEKEEEEEISSPEPKRRDSGEERKKPIKKKGVGYGSDQTGQNQKWNTQDYINRNRSRSDQLQSLLQIVKSFFDFKWGQTSLGERLRSLVLESSLLPLLESAFRSGSLLEMSKDADLNLSYLSLTKVLAAHKVLTPVLMSISPLYVPKQIESVAHLLSQLKDVADIFFKTMSEGTDSVSKTIAKAIIDTQEAVQGAVDHYEMLYDDDTTELQHITLEKQLSEILALPLPKAYQLLLKDLRFDYVTMKEENKYDHHYDSNIGSAGTPSSQKLVRLAQEFADMSNSLPIDHTNSIFVRADKDRVDVMKAMIMGAKGTPYAHGAYVFDIFFDDNYPAGPPKVNLSTTGSGRVRFNPNLYACGKVCLSLLGTWRGHASENWDPKISTLLQILVSIQAIIMSEEIYFNEPGFEGEAGTEEGDKKNEAYSNIVRYSNIQFAMIDTIKTPPKGFESVVLRHFYLKREEILEECTKWVRYAEQHEASYKGLVSDHNSNWCVEFSSKKTKYLEMMQTALKELESVLGGLQPPSAADLVGSKLLKRKRAIKNKDIKEGMVNIDDVDVTYGDELQVKQMDIQDETVRDRWSRYIGVMGLEAVQKQSNASVFISGMGALGQEIAKNIVLSGVKRLTIHDDTPYNLGGRFIFPSEYDMKRSAAECILNQIQQLNYYVRVDTMASTKQTQSEDIESCFPELTNYDVVVLSEWVTHTTATAWSHFCRSHKIKLIIASVDGVFARLINDFGEDFLVVDKNGEEIPEVMIKDISNATEGRVELIQGQRHLFEDGDLLLINNVEGMLDAEGKSINGTLHKMKTINKSTFSIQDTSGFSKYLRNGTAKLVKTPITLQFQPIHDLLQQSPPLLDPTLAFSDYMKLDNPLLTHIAYETMSKKSFVIFDHEEFKDTFLEVAKKYIPVEDLEAKQDQILTFVIQFAVTAGITGPFAPLAAFFGGLVSQEIIKCLTNKFIPVRQIYYHDCVEVLPLFPKDAQQLSLLIHNLYDPAESLIDIRRQLNIRLLGLEVTEKLEQMNLFMVGCGAIGCELLKNFAMLNVGIQGSITITDPDHIETSNLNRQFLFREKHIMKSKSQTAAAAIQQMNPLLKGHIVARSDKVYEATEHIFTDQFFEGLTLVANALDNVQARRYVDRRCVTAKVALLESGTLGPKGHVQCIIPFKTESYGSTNDPIEEGGDIPYCTLKMFPEETFHCIEFARDKFGKLFTLLPKSAMKILEDVKYEPQNPEELKALRESVKLMSSIPSSYDDCISWALRKYFKYFRNDIKQLLYTYPLDQLTKDGKPFWTLPKRPPTPLDFSVTSELDVLFVSTLAHLRANMFAIVDNKDWRSKERRQQVALKAANIVVEPWIASENKKQAINSEVAKQEDKSTQQEESKTQDLNVAEKTTLLNKMQEIRQRNLKLKVEEFEKDNDPNGHIDFIHAFGNLRASNYKLDVMDWLTVKIKAGRIVPALATTTAAVAGLQTIELVKMVKQVDLQHMKNAFMNLAVPYMQLTEPGGAPQIKLNETVTVNLWDRWDVKGGNMQLNELFITLEETYKLRPVNVFYKSSPIYMHDIHSKVGKEKERDQILYTTLTELFNLDDEPNYCDLTINFTSLDDVDHNLINNVPMVRIYK